MQRRTLEEYSAIARNFCGGDTRRALLQYATTFALFIALYGLMLYLAQVSYVLVLILTPIASGLLVRLFIFQHDCGHGSYTSSPRLNNALGHLASVLTNTPYETWRREHAHHHRMSGNLQKRGIGEIDLLTVREYHACSSWKKIKYHTYRSMTFLLLVGGPLYFIVLNRLPWFRQLPGRSITRSILALDSTIAALFGIVGWFVGYWTLVSVWFPICYLASIIGVWLFYIQHQFEAMEWYEDDTWDFRIAALRGSSYYDLPPILAWFTGNIGIHHIHHLSSRVPNYRLKECLNAMPELKSLNRLTLFESFRCAKLKLWDEDQRRLVPFPT